MNDPAFKKYLVSSGTYFIMCHDGARAAHHLDIDHSAEEASYWDRQKSTFRRMIGQFMSLGFNVALVNGLEIRDTKVRAEPKSPHTACALCGSNLRVLIEGNGHDSSRETQSGHNAGDCKVSYWTESSI